jgi:hypothetical protein
VAGDIIEGVQFGREVAISGDTIVVGASRGPEVDPWPAGSAYVFSRDEGGTDNWGQVQKISASNGFASDPGDQNNDAFGEAVSIDGDTIVVGAPKRFNGFADKRGSAYVFQRSGGGPTPWGEVAELVASDQSNDLGFFGGDDGQGVFIRGDLIVVGDRRDDTNRGAAYLFGRNEGGKNSWGEIEKVVASDAAIHEGFGSSVGTDGVQVIIGADDADGTCMPVVVPCMNSGAAYIYEPDPAVTPLNIDVGVGGGGFNTAGNVNLGKGQCGVTCTKDITVKPKNFGDVSMSINYQVISTPAGPAFSAACVGQTPTLQPNSFATIGGCTATYDAADAVVGTFVLELMTSPAFGEDVVPSNNSDDKTVQVNP